MFFQNKRVLFECVKNNLKYVKINNNKDTNMFIKNINISEIIKYYNGEDNLINNINNRIKIINKIKN